MEESSDFTFCQVGSSSDQDNIESPKTIPDISNIKIKDGSVGIAKIAERGGSSNNDTAKDVGGSVPIFSRSFEFQTPPTKGGRPLDQATSETNVNGFGKSSEVVRKPVQRAKVPFEKGYSQMDWLKLTRTHPDLAGLNGGSNRKLISMEEVRKHKTDGSVWTVLKGRVYNITPYFKFHPGGVDMLMKAAGKDCTALFNKYHAWVNAEFLLDKCLVGILDDNHNK